MEKINNEKKISLKETKQLENNEIVNAKYMTSKEFDREMNFVNDFIEKNNKVPTFSDCIETTRNELIEKVCNWLFEHTVENVSRYDEIFVETDVFETKKEFIERIRKAMNE